MLASCEPHADQEDEMARTANAEWKGTLKEGEGTLALGSGSFEGRYTYKSRFEDGPGTNPEELIGAAEAGCFTMQLAAALAQAGHNVESVRTEARVQIRNIDGAPTISQIALTARARVPGLDDAELQSTAREAKDTCIISRALAGVGDITLDIALES
jgi:lipoyl-dependent peroxiredoxin